MTRELDPSAVAARLAELRSRYQPESVEDARVRLLARHLQRQTPRAENKTA